MKQILKHTFRVWWSVLLATGFLCGCTSTEQVLPKPSEEKPTSTKALIVLEKAPFLVGGGIRHMVYDNHRFVGKVGPSGKLVWLRDPGLMDLQIREESPSPYIVPIGSRCLAVEAGESYCYKLPRQGFEGPGNSTILSEVKYYSSLPMGGNQSNEGSLVFFRFFPKTFFQEYWLTITDIHTEKSIGFYFFPYYNKDSWAALYLPPGEYNVLRCESYGASGGAAFTLKRKDRINAEFSVTKPNVGVYIGDITFSAEKFSISRDSNAARDFFMQSGIKLPYTEAIMELNR